ncbi:hypothetical protein V5799_034181 [Amblyomma americanum]|uniref:Peptidase M13 N-terminal domain-containing protein n=1 Tax=Amblyomma americanum TaxID=6943 RepID=A0AAQ4DL67_AMBAM
MLHEFAVTTSLTDLTLRSPTFRASLFVLATLASVLLLLMLLMPTPNTLRGTCSSSYCRRAATDLEALMDAAVDPCDDFYHHVCNVWLSKHDKGVDFAHAAFWNGLDTVQLALLEHKRTAEGYANLHEISQLAAIFKSCLKFLASSSTLAEENLPEAFGNDAEVLKLKNVKEALQTVVRLSLIRGISTMFQVSLIKHRSENVSLYITQAVPLAEKLRQQPHSSTFVQFVAEILIIVLRVLPAHMTRNINATALRLVEFDKKVSAGDPTHVLATITDLRKPLEQLVGGGNFVHLVNSILPETSTLVGTSQVFCSGLNSIRATLEYFRQKLHLGLLYIFVHVLMEIGQFYYAKDLFGKKPRYAAQFCLEASRDVMPPNVWSAVFNSLAALDSTREAENSSMESMFDHIRKMSSSRPPLLGMEESDKLHALSALSSVRLLSEIGTPDLLSNGSESKHAGSTNPEGLFGNMHVNLKLLESSRRLSAPPYLEDMVRNLYATTGDCAYSPLLNAVVLPSALRHAPFAYSSEEVPIEFDLGTVGALLARSVFQAGLPSPRSAFTWSTENVAPFVHCHEQQAPLLLHTLFQHITPSQTLDLFAWARSVKIAHGVMVNVYRGAGNMSTSEFEWKLAQRTFFRRFCLTTCNTADENGPGANARLRCLAPVLGMPEFYSAFNCPVREVNILRYCLDSELS